jgi:hypothetical protein
VERGNHKNWTHLKKIKGFKMYFYKSSCRNQIFLTYFFVSRDLIDFSLN